MESIDIFLIFLEKLNLLNINYVVTGSVASIVYGEPRLTHDIDLVVDIRREDLNRFTAVFPSSEFYCPPEESLNLEINRPNRGHFNLFHYKTGFKADIYIVGEDKFSRWAIENSLTFTIESEKIKIAPIEYVIIRKLEYYKEGNSRKHINDIAAMLKISYDKINMQILMKSIIDFSLHKEWEKCQQIRLNFH